MIAFFQISNGSIATSLAETLGNHLVDLHEMVSHTGRLRNHFSQMGKMGGSNFGEQRGILSLESAQSSKSLEFIGGER